MSDQSPNGSKPVEEMLRKPVTLADFGGNQKNFYEFIKSGGAAVRGEAVAELPARRFVHVTGFLDADYIDFKAGALFGGGVLKGVEHKSKHYTRETAEEFVAEGNWREVSVSASAADAPSEPSEPQAVQQLRKSLAGWIDEAAALRKSLDQARADLELRALHQKNDAWYWQGDGTDFPESISNSMCIVMRGDQLRALVDAGKSRAADVLDSQPTVAAQQGSIADDAQFQILMSKYIGKRQFADKPSCLAAYKELTAYIDSRASSAPVAPIAPYAYEETNGDSSSLIYAAWFTSGRGKMDEEKTYEPLYRLPQQEGSEAGNG